MKFAKILLFLLSNPCFAETFFYSDHYLTIDLRSDQPTILKFTKVPLSSVCQPGILQFEPLDQKSLNLGEQQRTQEIQEHESNSDTTISQLIRVTPQESAGTTTCSFTLAGGDEVPVRFNLMREIARPFIELRPLAEKFPSTQVNSGLTILESLIKGESIYLHDITNEFDECKGRLKDQLRECKRERFSTPTADYELSYVGTDTAIKAWTLTLTLKEPTDFSKIADLKSKHGSGFLYSVVTPQKARFESGETLKHFIVSSSQVTKLELKEALP